MELLRHAHQFILYMNVRMLIFQVEDMRVDIEVHSDLSPGQTVCDKWHTSKRPKNCRVVQKVSSRNLN